MKKLFLTIALVSYSLSISAQSFSWGPKIGIAVPSIKVSDVQDVNSGAQALSLLEDVNGKVSGHIGVFARISLLGFYIQPELLVSSSKSEVGFNIPTDDFNLESVMGEVKLNKLDIPVLIGKRFLKVLRVNAGPVFTLPLNEDISFKNLTTNIEDVKTNYKSATIGAQIGAGLDLTFLTVDVRYELALQSLSEGISIGNAEFAADQRVNQFLIAIGVKF
ncbi:PorT family protein [Flavobacteriales bacterium]|nr:PorT family protein [Flavobacteriales bacterium]